MINGAAAKYYCTADKFINSPVSHELRLEQK